MSLLDAAIGPLGFPFSVRVIYHEAAMVEGKERLFPASRNRSARVRKKLIRRYGREFRLEPGCLQTPYGFVIHPSLRAAFEAAVERRRA